MNSHFIVDLMLLLLKAVDLPPHVGGNEVGREEKSRETGLRVVNSSLVNLVSRLFSLSHPHSAGI